ncbi:MAG: sigma-70 family RNA polymerase sigma factor [Eubacteriales bacterium]|nr:sigma-70 family RNA polymerase sigma factor [Eubacteriales bacterium]
MIIYLQMIESDADKTKFEQLYTAYKGLMFHVALSILKNEPDAEDAVHQAFLSVIENLKKISDVRCPKTRAYIVIITERKAIDMIRSRSKLVDMAFEENSFGIDISLPGDHGLGDAMAQLPAAYREILLLRYYNGYSVRELAPMLHMKKDAAQKLLWRAKKALQKNMEGDEQNGQHALD